MFRKFTVGYAIGLALEMRGMGPENPPPMAVAERLVPVVEGAANAQVDAALAGLPASAAPYESFSDMAQALGRAAVERTMDVAEDEVEAVVGAVLAERPLTWWSRNWRWRLLGRKRDEVLNRAYLRGIVDGAIAMQRRLAVDPDAWARIANEGRAGAERPSDLCTPVATMVLNRKDYASSDEYNGATMVYNVGFDLAQVTLILRRNDAWKASRPHS
jgi:hypothetical protein